MDDEATAPAFRAFRCAPFVMVMLCFLLPLFSVSSCSDGAGDQQATATGVDVVLGRTIHADPPPSVNRVSTDDQAAAQSIAHEVRPWAIVTLILCALGIALSIGLRHHRRLANAGVTLATLVAVVLIGKTVTAPGDVAAGTPESGLMLAGLVLVVSLAVQVCVSIWIGLAHPKREAAIASAGERGPPRP
jgi:hypothetical protein